MVTQKKKIIAGVLAVVAGGTLFFTGCRHSLHNRHSMEGMIRYLTAELELTNPQQDMLYRFKETMAEKRKEMAGSRRAHKAVLKEELMKEKLDTERLLALYNDHKPKMDQMAELIISNAAEFHGSLSPEQRDKLIGTIESWEKFHSYFSPEKG